MNKKIFLASFLAVTATLSGCAGNSEKFEPKEYSFNSANYLEIDAKDRTIVLEQSQDDELHIDCFESDKEYFNVSNTEGRIIAALNYSKEIEDFFGLKSPEEYRKIKISVPNDIQGIAISTTNGDISLGETETSKYINLISEGGNIMFESICANELKLEAKNGDIKGAVSGGWDDYSIQCSVKKGNSNLPESKDAGKKSLIISINNGDAEIEFEPQNP